MKRIGIIRGGGGRFYDSSLRKGGEIISHIFENLSDKFKIFDILIDKDGVWHLSGVPILPADLLHKVDVVWDTTRPSATQILTQLSIPHVAVGHFSHSLEESKEMLSKQMEQVGLSLPRHIVLPVYQTDFDGPRERYSIKKAKEVHEKFGAPWIVKSFTPDAGMGIHLAKTFNELVAAIEDGVKHGKSILVEEFIAGKVASVHTVPNFRGEELYTFPFGNAFGTFSNEEKEKLVNLAKDLHQHLDARHYLKSDFVMNPRGKVYLLNFELHPDLKPGSHLSQVAESVGAKMHHIVEHILES